MPIKHAAIKDLRKNEKRAKRNERTKQNVRHLLRKAQILLDEKGSKGSVETARSFQQAIDKAVKVGVISKNKAARRKSTIMKKLNAK